MKRTAASSSGARLLRRCGGLARAKPQPDRVSCAGGQAAAGLGQSRVWAPRSRLFPVAKAVPLCSTTVPKHEGLFKVLRNKNNKHSTPSHTPVTSAGPRAEVEGGKAVGLTERGALGRGKRRLGPPCVRPTPADGVPCRDCLRFKVSMATSLGSSGSPPRGRQSALECHSHRFLKATTSFQGVSTRGTPLPSPGTLGQQGYFSSGHTFYRFILGMKAVGRCAKARRPCACADRAASLPIVLHRTSPGCWCRPGVSDISQPRHPAWDQGPASTLPEQTQNVTYSLSFSGPSGLTHGALNRWSGNLIRKSVCPGRLTKRIRNGVRADRPINPCD